MTAQSMHTRGFTAISAGVLVTSVAVVIIGVLFAAEGLLGYFYNASMFMEGLDHVIEIYSGLGVAILGTAVSAYVLLRR